MNKFDLGPLRHGYSIIEVVTNEPKYFLILINK